MPKWYILGWYIYHPSPFGEVTKPPRYHLAYLENEHDNKRVIEGIKWVNVCVICLGEHFEWGVILSPYTMRAKLLQSCPALCNPMDCGLPGSLSLRLPRLECWSELLCLLRWIKPISLMSPALAGWYFTTSAIWEAPIYRRGLEKVHQLTWARSGISPDILTWEPVLLTTKLSIFF